MKNKKIMILSIITNIILIGFICSFININGDIIREKQIIKEMSESNQVTDLNNQINSLNTEHTEYMNYIQTCKTQLASVISNEGVTTSENDTFEKMVTNIGDIFTQRTKLDESVAATADNISEGKQAYVNGKLITGTGVDNDSYYEQGKSETVGSLKTVSKSKTVTLYSDRWTYIFDFSDSFTNKLLGIVGISSTALGTVDSISISGKQVSFRFGKYDNKDATIKVTAIGY